MVVPLPAMEPRPGGCQNAHSASSPLHHTCMNLHGDHPTHTPRLWRGHDGRGLLYYPEYQ